MFEDGFTGDMYMSPVKTLHFLPLIADSINRCSEPIKMALFV